MTRLEKIILEQLKKGQFGERSADSTLSSKLNNKFKYGIISFYFVDTHGRGNKYDAFTADQVIERIDKSIKYITYSNGEYVFVIDDQNPTSGKKETLWNVYIIDKKKTFPNISDQVFAENKSGQFNQSFIITFKQYDELLKKQAELVATTTKEKAAADAEKKKPAIEKTKVVVQNVIKGTETIDVNNLGKGTPDAKAFQELLYQVGLKYVDAGDRGPTTVFGKFAKWRTKGSDGGWDGDIGTATLNMLDKLSLKDQYNSGDIAGVIKYLRGEFVTNESTNYFKGTGMNIKLKDLLQEQIKVKSDAEVRGGGGNAGGGVRTPKPTNKTYTQANLPLGNVTGKLIYDNKDTFEGSWKDRKKSGLGTYTWSNGDKYVGEYKDGKKSGPGTLKLKTGNIYEGPWSNGKKNGEFKITYPNDDTRVGTFSNSLLSGPVTFTPKDGEPVQEIWKDSKLLKSNATYWSIAKDWVVAEYNFWEGKGKGPKGQKRPVSHRDMFVQFNSTGFGNFIGQDDEDGAAKAYKANRKIALQWLDKELAGSVEVTGHDYYTKIKKWIDKIVDSIDDVFQNDCTVTLTNDAEGDTITRTVQGEIDVDW